MVGLVALSAIGIIGTIDHAESKELTWEGESIDHVHYHENHCNTLITTDKKYFGIRFEYMTIDKNYIAMHQYHNNTLVDNWFSEYSDYDEGYYLSGGWSSLIWTLKNGINTFRYLSNDKIICTYNVNYNPSSTVDTSQPSNMSTQQKDRLISDLQTQLNTYRQQLSENNKTIADLNRENVDQQKKIDKQRKTIANKKGALIEEKKSDDDRLVAVENTLKILINMLNTSKTITSNTIISGNSNHPTIELDRTVYPVPYGMSNNTNGSMFKDQNGDNLPANTVAVTIRVYDPDFNLNPLAEDKIALNGNGPVKVTISRSGNECTIAYVGGMSSNHTGNTLAGLCPVIDPDNNELVETSPESGIFENVLDIGYSMGPSSNDCPDQTTCILQGDIITVQYTDPTDASGNERTVADSATFDLRNGALQTDKSVYVIGSSMIVTLIDPDLDLDSSVRETYPLNIINWDSDAGTVNLDNAIFDATPGSLRETGPSTGIFQVVIEIPSAIGNERLERGEEITLQYVDYGPSGADFVGDNTEDIERTVFTSNFGATIELDQAVYTWTDKVFITITAPDHNLNSNQVDEIGADPYPIRVATRSDSIDNYKLVETNTNTGIFTGEVILTGFPYNADGNNSTGDVSGNDTTGDECNNCNGPTDGMLPTDNDDGLEVSFEFSDGETVRKSALIRWNIGEVQWLEASYPATSSGILRVIDSDMNLNPEAVDNFEVKVWSSDSPSGITLTVEETQPASGIFEGTVFFGLDVSSGGHRLNVQEGDTVTARYTDNTLPEPYSQGDSEYITATTIIGINNTTYTQLQSDFRDLQIRYNSIESQYNTTLIQLSDIRSKFSTIESLYNSTIDDNNEKQHTIDKLQQELDNATKKIEELESKDSQSQFQGSSSDESSNNDETNNEPSDEPIEPVEVPTLQITLLESMTLDNTYRTIDLYTYGTNNIRIDTYYPDTGTQYYINDKADITIYRDTEITNRQFITTNQDSYCYVGDLVVGQDPSIPISVQHTNALQLQFRESDDPTRCDAAPNILFNEKLSLNKEVYVRFAGTSEQVPFYYTDNEVTEIPKCNTDNFDSATNQLLDGTETCYGKSGSDTVIISKILALFGITIRDLS